MNESLENLNPATAPEPEATPEPVKKKRGRPKGSGKKKIVEPEIAPAAMPEAIVLGIYLKAPFKFLAQLFGNHWKLSEKESEQLAEASLPLIEKYGAAFWAKWGFELVFVGTLAMITIPRIKTDIDIAKAKKKELAEKESDGKTGKRSTK